ncbi:hypothetical protein F2Q69_00051564 [Brassica cretica]|uniref:Leucine-rich repeat-containing N-terminal plant-type domain-containing protein n=1 Tax=Brassica cretica TaxID=69181 RepID=A0A8S9PPT5_BRACR|nr:hypothetical protein F2Q69_00051564 [Brassica cretica]
MLSCIQKERKALLELKQYLISISEEGQSDYVLPTWTNDTKSQCCWWEGVKCSRTSGRVTKIAFGDLFLKESSFFNLSLLHPFEEVQSLDLSECAFSALFDDIQGYKSLSRLRKLEILDLSPIMNSTTASFPFLTLLQLRNLTKLELLDLSGNGYNSSMPVFCGMKNLQELYLSGNYFSGRLPLCLGGLNKLHVLDLSLNQLSGNLPSSFSRLESLEYLSLSDNNFTGLFSLNLLANLTRLKVFKLSSTSDMLQVDAETTWLPKFQLSIASLPFCGLEKIPNFLMYQKKLHLRDLSSNIISGTIPSWLLANNPELEVLQLQNNSFTVFQIPTTVHILQFLDLSANNINGVLPDDIGHVLPNLKHMNGSHNGFQGNFPSSIGEMKNILFLDLSHNNLSGELPRPLFTGCYSLQILHLSHNHLGGDVLPRQTNLTSLVVLRMDNNLFTGEIKGSIPRDLFGLKNIGLLDLSNNKLSGNIPSCLYNLSFGSGEYEQVRNGASEAYGFVPSLQRELYRTTFLVDEFKIDYETYMSFEIQFAAKQRYDSYTEESEFSRGTVDFMYGLDLSSNELSGVIPSELGELSKLRAMKSVSQFLVEFYTR